VAANTSEVPAAPDDPADLFDDDADADPAVTGDPAEEQ
jgi:hypothetical protein